MTVVNVGSHADIGLFKMFSRSILAIFYVQIQSEWEHKFV